MTWLRSNWLNVAVVLAVVVAVAGMLRSAHWKGVYEAEAANADRQAAALLIQRREIEAARARMVRDSAALDETRARAMAKSDSLSRASEALQSTRRELDTFRTRTASEALALGDSTGSVPVGMVREYVDSTTKQIAVLDTIVAAQTERADVQTARAERAESAAAQLRVDLRNADLFAAAKDMLLATKDREIDALRHAVAPSFFERAKGDLATIGAACAAAAGMARQDRMVVAGGCLAGALIVEAIR